MKKLTLDKLPKRVLANLDLETAFVASRSVVAAERLELFRRLNGKKLSATVIGRRTGIHRRHCEPFLDVLVSLGLLSKAGNLYRNSRLADRYFVEKRSPHWTRFWSYECVRDYEALSVLEEVLTSGKDYRTILGKDRRPDYELSRNDSWWGYEFAYALFWANEQDAETVARFLDLSGYENLLDVGGGSGVMSIALAKANPRLKACVLDFEHVCKAANEIIRKHGMARRIKTLTGDMYKSLPGGHDVVMFWEIGHIDTRVMKLAYDSLSDGGMIIRSCPPTPRRKVPSANTFLLQYTSVRPPSQSKSGILESLKEAGFQKVRYRNIDRGLGMITGMKKRELRHRSRRE